MQQFYSYFIFFLLCFTSFITQANDFDYIKQQAQQGNPIAQYVLANMYQQAKSVQKSKKYALSWYEKSAAQNYLPSQYALIAIYQHASGVTTPSKKASYWNRKTTEPRSLALINQQQQSFNHISQYLKNLAINDNSDAQYLLATLYASNRHEEVANYWFLKAAIAGDEDAQYYTGVTYMDHTGLLNKTQGFYWLEKAATQGHLDAQIVLAASYEQNKTFAPDFKKAAYWYEKAAEQGDAKAQSYIAGMYRDGNGVPLNKELALKWYTKSAEQGDAFSQYNLGLLYETGNGVKRDIKKALHYYRLGALQGHAASKLKLESLQANTQ